MKTIQVTPDEAKRVSDYLKGHRDPLIMSLCAKLMPVYCVVFVSGGIVKCPNRTEAIRLAMSRALNDVQCYVKCDDTLEVSTTAIGCAVRAGLEYLDV